MTEPLQELIERFRQAGCKATPARLAILNILKQTGKPLSVQQIQKKLEEGMADQATVYRTVQTLQDIGLVKPIDFQHGHAHFELTFGPHHHHIVCTACGQVEDVIDCGVERMAKQALKNSKDFATIKQHSLEFFGVCRRCNRR
jgi:Fe2+ or Zn2+ uptake regulation protein